MESSQSDRTVPAPAQRSGDPIDLAFDVNDATAYSGGWSPVTRVAGHMAGRFAPLALGVLGAGGGVPAATAFGAVVPQALKSVYDAMPLPGNVDTPIRRAGAGYRQDFYNDLNRGNYGRAVKDALIASGLTLGQFIRDLPPPVPRNQP